MPMFNSKLFLVLGLFCTASAFAFDHSKFDGYLKTAEEECKSRGYPVDFDVDWASIKKYNESDMGPTFSKLIGLFEVRCQKMEAATGAKFKINWDSIPQNTNAIERVGNIVGQFATMLWQLGQDEMSRDEMNKQIKEISVLHDGTSQDEYQFGVAKNGSTLEFKANLEKFVFTNSSKQPSLRKSVEALL